MPLLSREAKAIHAFVEHVERMEEITLPLTAPTGYVDLALVQRVGQDQVTERRRYDKWLEENGWSHSDIGDLIQKLRT